MASPTVTAIFAAAESTAKAVAKGKKPPKHYYYTSRWFWASSCAVVAALMLLNVYKRVQAWRLVKKYAAEPLEASSSEIKTQESTAKISNLPSAIHAQWSNIASLKTSICPDWLYALPSLNELLFLALYAACSIVFAIHGTWSDKLKKYDAANQMGHIVSCLVRAR